MTLVLLATLAAAPDPALLERIAERTRAVETFTRNAQLSMTIVADELDSEGKSTKHTEAVVRVSRTDGKPARELISATENGKDVTAEKREEMDKERDKNGKNDRQQASPFHPDERAKYAFSMLAPSPAAPNLVRIAFQPAGEKTSELMIGDASVDPQTGELVRMSMRPSKNPSFVDNLFIEIELDAQTPAGRAASKITAKGAGGFLFIKKRFAVVTTISDYRALE